MLSTLNCRNFNSRIDLICDYSKLQLRDIHFYSFGFPLSHTMTWCNKIYYILHVMLSCYRVSFGFITGRLIMQPARTEANKPKRLPNVASNTAIDYYFVFFKYFFSTNAFISSLRDRQQPPQTFQRRNNYILYTTRRSLSDDGFQARSITRTQDTTIICSQYRL